jgi:hypothetical protein
LQQITCIERGNPGASPLPDEFLELEYIKEGIKNYNFYKKIWNKEEILELSDILKT